MFSFGLSSVLGNSTKKTHSTVNDDNWYLPYNGPYEEPPRYTTPQGRKQRDSWGDPIPFGLTTDHLEPSGGRDVLGKTNLRHQYEPRNIKYGVQGVFDDDWKRVGTPGVVRLGVTSDQERGRRASYGRDQRPSSFGLAEPIKTAFSMTSRRRSTVSSGNSPTVPDYMPLDGVSGGVGESPVPQRRAQKDANRISLGSIFTFGARMRMGSPTRSMDDREEKVDNVDLRPARPTSNPEKEHNFTPSTHAALPERHSAQPAKNKPTGYYSLSNGKEDYQDYYNSLYSSLVDDDNATQEDHPYFIHFKRTRGQPLPGSAAPDSRAPKPTQPRPRACSHQNLTVAPVGHPYAPYAHQNRTMKDEKLPSPASDENPLPYHQRHPYNQTQPAYTRHPYGQSSVSTGASSPSHIAVPQKRGSGSENHGDSSHTSTNAVVSHIGITSTGVGGAGSEVGMNGKQLKISRSTPNFRNDQSNDLYTSAAGPSNAIHQITPPLPSPHTKQLPPPRHKDRWLSAETWCDALVFPRPRLKLKQGKKATLYSQGDESFIGGRAPSGSGRIVSPPPSPLGGEWDIEIRGEETQLHSRLRDQGVVIEVGAVQKQREPGIPSRVLAHSRSFDVQTMPGNEKAGDNEFRAVRHGKVKATPVARDRGDMQDILLPPSPVADLSEVISEGRLLDEERQEWQSLAANSFGNKRSRSLSRTRTKSLTRKGRSSIKRKERNAGTDESDGQGGEPGQSSFEYLAAQACLGNQAASMNCNFSPPLDATNVPAIHTSGLSRNNSTGVGNSTQSGHGMHSHSNSHSTTSRAKLTKSQSKTHSRNNSVGNSAVHVVSKLCGNLGLDVDLNPNHEKVNSQGPSIRTAPDLEGALKGHGTKVIRLADPAHIPVDKGLPVPQSTSPNPLLTQNQGRTPSPGLSVSTSSDISQSKVGIAIGTPEEAEGVVIAVVPAGPLAVTASYVPSHPYAQGGLSFSVQTQNSSGKRPIDSRLPSEGHSDSKVPPLSEILARHKVSPHPYALPLGQTVQEQSTHPSSRLGINLARDSYLDANGLVGQFRSNDKHPDPTRMWAQLSPDVVREVLPGDLQYSPYDSDVKGIEKLEGTSRMLSHHKEGGRMNSIHDTAGVAEALLSTTRFGRDRIVVDVEHQDEVRTLKRKDSSEQMSPTQANLLATLFQPSNTYSVHTIASSHLDPVAKSPSSTHHESLDRLETASSIPTSGSPSPGFRPLGSPNDLDSYQDLFYQPSPTDVQHPSSLPSPESTTNTVSWDAAVRNRRTGSSLTSLVRQFSEEYEALASVNASRASSMYLHTRSRSLGAPGLSTDGNLRFVLEEMASAAESTDRIPSIHETVHAFESANLPEDVYSVQTSSTTDVNGEEDDPTGLLRLGTVDSLTTPLTVDVEHRTSFNGETIFDYEDQDHTVTDPRAAAAQPGSSSQVMEHSRDAEDTGTAVRRRELPIGQRPLTEITRSSCMTTSDLSRMSGLSDFPVPPKSIYSERHDSSLPPPPSTTLTPQHLSVFNTYFTSERQDESTPRQSTSLTRLVVVENGEERRGPSGSSVTESHDLQIPRGREVEFGVNQSAVELAKSLSSPGVV